MNELTLDISLLMEVTNDTTFKTLRIAVRDRWRREARLNAAMAMTLAEKDK